MGTETSKTYVFGNEGNNTVPAWLAYGNNGGWGNGFGGGWGTGILGFLLGALFNGGFGGFGNGFGFGGNGAAAAGYLGNQMNNDNNTDLIMNAINGTDADVRLLATTLNADVNEVKSAINTVQSAIQTVGSQVGMSGLQIINAVQNGNASIASQLCECCCNMKQLVTEQGFQSQLRTVEQTGAINNGFAAVNQNIAATKAAQELSDCKQTYTLTDTMNRNYQLLDNKIDALESSRKDREITALTAQVAKLESQNFTAGIVQQAVAPLNAAINGIAREVDDIKCKLPNTINVEYPQVGVYNATPNVNNFGWNGGFFGNGFGGNIIF